MFPLWKMVTKLRIELSVFDSVLFICRVRSCSHFSLGIVGISTEEPLPIFLVSSSGHIYTQNILFVVSWDYVHSWFWQLRAFCCYLLSPSLVFLAHLFLYTQNSTKTISCPQVCLLLPVKHRRQYIWVSEGPQYSFCFGKQLLLLKLRPICLEQRMAIIARNSMTFCRSSQAWVKRAAEFVPFSSQSPPEWSWTGPTFNHILFCQI